MKYKKLIALYPGWYNPEILKETFLWDDATFEGLHALLVQAPRYNL